MKKVILIILLLITYLNVNADECNNILKKVFIDKVHKVNETGESLENVKFTLHDIRNEISFNYTNEGLGYYSLTLYHKKEICNSGNIGMSYKNKNSYRIQKLSETISVEDAGDRISELVLSTVSSINNIDEWNEKIPGYYRAGYHEIVNGNTTTRETNVLYPMILEEETVNGYLPADKYIIVLSGILTNSYYSNGHIYEKKFDFDSNNFKKGNRNDENDSQN